MTTMLSTLSEQTKSAATAPTLPAGPVLVADNTVLCAPVPRSRGGLPPRALRRVREYIEAHLDERISIDSLAGIADLSMFHFARAFKQSEGVTPHDYLVQRRIKRAMELLAGTDLPLSEIALAVGFTDQSHCARRFREYVGICPRDYRWSMR
jgi:AraC-like DNA-binding protein